MVWDSSHLSMGARVAAGSANKLSGIIIVFFYKWHCSSLQHLYYKDLGCLFLVKSCDYLCYRQNEPYFSSIM